MPDHILIEHDLKRICPYCKEDNSKKHWQSELHGTLHYKTITCNCGKDLNIKVNFIGNGHDLWSGAPSWMIHGHPEKTSEKKLDAVIEAETAKLNSPIVAKK